MDKEQRIKYLEEELSHDPKDEFTLYALGLEYLPIDLNKAIFFFEQLLSISPQYLSNYYQLGLAYFKINKEEEAKEVLKKGIILANEKKDLHSLSELKNALNNIELGLDFD